MERERNRRVGAVRSFPVALMKDPLIDTMKDPLIDTTAPWAFLTDGNPVFLDDLSADPGKGLRGRLVRPRLLCRVHSFIRQFGLECFSFGIGS